MRTLPSDYVERVYAGVLGKMIGVYLGRPFEGWNYERIMAELGEIWYYVHEQRKVPLIVTDDDLAGTFTFLRALADNGYSPELTPAQIGQTWLNYIVEKRTILWWGGLGNSSEHTAYLRLKSGIPAPRSGSIALNGPVVAQQIGAQIFIDGWAMVSPGDPEQAAELARKAASVSHDGEAIYGAQALAAMEAQAFIESDIGRLLDTGVSQIPADSLIYRMIADLREWHLADKDWRKTFERIEAQYGYKDFIGGCHIVPNHALIILGLLYGEGDFQRSLMICNTCGWDTDCNSGNLGCLLGIRNGMAAFEGGPDWRGPLADRLYLSTADGGRAITDAVIESFYIVNAGRALAGLEPVAPKGGARFHFELPGSVQGFEVETGQDLASLEVTNIAGHSGKGTRSLALHIPHMPAGGVARVSSPTFIPVEALKMPGYELVASPTLYSGQRVRARLSAAVSNPSPLPIRLFLRAYNADDQLTPINGPEYLLLPGAEHEIFWQVPATAGAPIAQIGLEMGATGTVFLDYLTWDGSPEAEFTRPLGSSLPEPGPQVWRRAWVNGVDHWEPVWRESFRVVQNYGRGLLITGTREWLDYRVSAIIVPALIKSGGLAVRVQGMQRFYALLLTGQGLARLVKAQDGDIILAETPCEWEIWQPYEFDLQVEGNRLSARINGQLLFDVADADHPLESGGIGLVCEEGHLLTDTVSVRPVASI